MSRDFEGEVVLQVILEIENLHVQTMLSGAKIFSMFVKYAPRGFPVEADKEFEMFVSSSGALQERLTALLKIIREEPIVTDSPRP